MTNLYFLPLLVKLLNDMKVHRYQIRSFQETSKRFSSQFIRDYSGGEDASGQLIDEFPAGYLPMCIIRISRR
jgi:hypothetical protein